MNEYVVYDLIMRSLESTNNLHSRRQNAINKLVINRNISRRDSWDCFVLGVDENKILLVSCVISCEMSAM